MIVDGKAIAKTIYKETAKQVLSLSRTPILAAVTCAPNFETKKYLSLKQRKAAEVGIELRIIEMPETITTADAIREVEALLSVVDGVVVQLPFPPQVDREKLLMTVPTHKDPDGFSYGVDPAACLPPVVAAIKAIADVHQISFAGKRVVVLGQGRLVGTPTAQFMRTVGAQVIPLTEADGDPTPYIKEADVLVSGIGVPHFVTVDMVQPGIIIFDGGTSEDGGLVTGDVHPDVAHRAALFTPVPGGIGPITIAALLRNLISLCRQ